LSATLGERAMNTLPDFGLKGKNIGLKLCSFSGMTRSTSSTRFELTMEISIFFDNETSTPDGQWELVSFRQVRSERNIRT
jgi:hypothetical protein